MPQIPVLNRTRIMVFIATALLASCGSSKSDSSNTGVSGDTLSEMTSSTQGSPTTTIDPMVQNFVTTTPAPIQQESDGRVFEAGGNYSGIKPRFEDNQFDFSRFDLQETNFSRAVLNTAWLRFADLTGSNFSRSKMSCRDSDMFGTSCASLDSADFTDADLSYATMTGISALGTIFTRANLSHADLGFFQVKNDAASIINDTKNWTPCS